MYISKKSLLFLLFIITFVMLLIDNLSFPGYEGGAVSNVSASTTFTYFSIGTGGSDVIPHQVVRANNDRLYIFANQQSSKIIRVYRTTASGLPANSSAFAAPIQLTETSNVISVDAVYDGGNIIHVLVNLQNGNVKDYPFNTTTDAFSAATTIASDSGTVATVLYVGTSGVAGMVDLSSSLHVTYWTNGNHILHRVYTYDSSTNTLSPSGSFVQVDTAGNANHPSVAISPVDNSLTVAWVSQADNPPKIRTRTRASNGMWGSVLSASTASVWTSSDSGINIDQGPSLIIDSTGVKHLTYIQSFDGGVGDYGRIHYVTDIGSGWTDQALSAFTHDPALAINAVGEIYIIGHGHPKNSACLSMDDMCTIKKNSNGTWGTPQLFAAHPGGNSFDSSPSVKWSVVGFNRPEAIEFIFFMTPYDNPTLYYGQILGSASLPTISGNAGVAGATLNYTGGSILADGSGNYSFSVSSGWSGTVTPTKACYTFSPVNQMYTNVTSNRVGQNYTATPVLSVTLAGSAGMSGVTLSYYDGTLKSVVSNGSGNYTFNVPCGWSGMVTPYKTGYTFTPFSRTYNNVQSNQASQNYTMQTCGGCADINVLIGGNPVGSYTLGASQSTRQVYPLDSGPVKVSSTNAVELIAALRDAWLVNGGVTSFAQLMGLPQEQLSDTYYFPAYNNVTLSGQLRIGNVDSIATDVTVTIGGVVQNNGQPYHLEPNQSVRPTYTLDSGPVVVQSNNGAKIIAALRDAWLVNGGVTSFTQLMGLPKESLSDTYYFPAYNNVTLSGQLRIGNVDTIATDVTVTIGGVVQNNGQPYHLLPNQSVRPTYTLDSGPVVVQSNNGAKIIAALRDAWLVNGQVTSFAQLMGLPKEKLSDTYLLPAYNNVTLSGQLRIGNVDSIATDVTVTIGGVVQNNGQPYHLLPNQSVRPTYNLDSGPVEVTSSNGAKIIVALRDAWLVNGSVRSFVQTMALPQELLSTTYWFPAYNNVTLSGQLRFAVP